MCGVSEHSIVADFGLGVIVFEKLYVIEITDIVSKAKIQ
jgi:hypothetical protein